MNWQNVDDRLIRRGELLLGLEFLERYDEELGAMNCGKVGRPFTLTHSHVVFLAVVRYLFGFPYRQLEGFTRALDRLIPRIPSADYSGLRKRILRLDLSPYEDLKGSNEPIAIAVDSTGISVHRAGGWIEREHGKKKRYAKIHFAVNVKTREVVAMEVSARYSYKVDTLKVSPDHIHLLLSLPPKMSIAEAVRTLKSLTARTLLEEFPELKKHLWQGSLWTRGYAVNSVGSLNLDTVRQYIMTEQEP